MSVLAHMPWYGWVLLGVIAWIVMLVTVVALCVAASDADDAVVAAAKERARQARELPPRRLVRFRRR